MTSATKLSPFLCAEQCDNEEDTFTVHDDCPLRYVMMTCEKQLCHKEHFSRVRLPSSETEASGPKQVRFPRPKAGPAFFTEPNTGPLSSPSHTGTRWRRSEPTLHQHFHRSVTTYWRTYQEKPRPNKHLYTYNSPS